MIIATAGHVDHGKTSLVRALTGVDTDRLPEEKKRGMTIDLGFAYIGSDAGSSIGFVDVPGHERFIHNMLCGVAGIDAALLIVATDDGPMPQTLEHLAILDLLEVRHGVVALTKIDRVAPERVSAVRDVVTRLLAPTSLAGMPVLPVSAMTGAGIAGLKQHLDHLAQTLPVRAANGNFRLAVDRAFTLSGVGLVVTGTAVSGAIAEGDAVSAVLAGIPARVRGIHAQNTAAARGCAGQRCALNLAGGEIESGAIGRGEWIVSGQQAPPVRKLDGLLRVAAGERKPLQHWTPVHVHLGASDVTGRVAMLEGAAIAPGASALAQLVLDHPIAAVYGDKFIVRDQSATRTLGGGHIIDVYPPARGRARPERIVHLKAMNAGDPAAALQALLQTTASGVDLEQFSRNRNLTSEEMDALLRAIPVKRLVSSARTFALPIDEWQRRRSAVLAAVAGWHQRQPDSAGPAEHGITDASGQRLPRELTARVVAELLRDGALIRNGVGIQLPGHRVRLTAADEKLWAKVKTLLEAGSAKPPSVAEIAAQSSETAKRVQALLDRLTHAGQISKISESRYLLPAQVARLAEIAQRLCEESGAGKLTAAAFRDSSGIGRNRAIEVLEYFDRVKFTRRTGDAHMVLRPARAMFAAAAIPESKAERAA